LTENENNSNHKPRGPYKRLERLHLVHQIENMLVKGCDISYILQTLGISERTFYRLRQQAFKDEKQALQSFSSDMLAELLSISSKRLLEVRAVGMKLANDSTMESGSRVDCLHLCAEVDRAILKVFLEGRQGIAQLVASRSYPQALDSPQETVQKHLTLVKNEKQQQPHHYEAND
jgi:hypothetical protein